MTLYEVRNVNRLLMRINLSPDVIKKLCVFDLVYAYALFKFSFI
jgi:hypothetical protein